MRLAFGAPTGAHGTDRRAFDGNILRSDRRGAQLSLSDDARNVSLRRDGDRVTIRIDGEEAFSLLASDARSLEIEANDADNRIDLGEDLGLEVRVLGGGGDDTFAGDARQARLSGGEGADRFDIAHAEDARLVGHGGDDRYAISAGDATVFDTSGAVMVDAEHADVEVTTGRENPLIMAEQTGLAEHGTEDVWFDARRPGALGEDAVQWSPVVLDLNHDGRIGANRSNGTIDDDTVLFDLDPRRAHWTNKSYSRRPEGSVDGAWGAPALGEGATARIYDDAGNMLEETEDLARAFDITAGRADFFSADGELRGSFFEDESTASNVPQGRQMLYHWNEGGEPVETREEIEWVHANRGEGADGLLVWDRDGNGRIEGSQELFGNFDTDGAEAYEDGYDKLAELDRDGDGWVQGRELRDAEEAGVKLWVDHDADAVTDGGELRSLDDYGIRGLRVSHDGRLRSSFRAQEATMDFEGSTPVLSTGGGHDRVDISAVGEDRYRVEVAGQSWVLNRAAVERLRVDSRGPLDIDANGLDLDVPMQRIRPSSGDGWLVRHGEYERDGNVWRVRSGDFAGFDATNLGDGRFLISKDGRDIGYYQSPTGAEKIASPLAFDLDGDGLATTDQTEVAFDLDGDGAVDRTAWIADGDDGVLAFGPANSGKSLFGNYTDFTGLYESLLASDALSPADQERLRENRGRMSRPELTGYANGFEALKDLAVLLLGPESVADGELGPAELGRLEALADLRFLGGDAQTSFSLADGGLESLSLSYETLTGDAVHVSGNDNEHRQVADEGAVVDGQARSVHDIWFRYIKG